MKCPVFTDSTVQFVPSHTAKQECSQGMVWPFLHRHYRTPTCAALTNEASQPFVKYSATFCAHLQRGFLSRLEDGVPSQPCGQVVWLFVAHRFPPLADLFPFPALPTAAPRPPVCGVPFSTSGAKCSRARHHRFPRGGLRRSFQNCRSCTHTRLKCVHTRLHPDSKYTIACFTSFSRLPAPSRRTAAAPARFCRHAC